MSKRAPDVRQQSEEALDLLMQGWVRFSLPCACLLVFFLDPVESGLPNKLTYLLVIFYSLYSACLIFLRDTQPLFVLTSHRLTHWIDTLFIASLVAFTGGANSIFFPFFYFPILIASLSNGFREGMKVTLVSAVLFSLAGHAFVSPLTGYDLGAAIMRPIYLLVFGSMIAHWGNGKIILKQRLSLLQEINTDWSPRFGANHAIMSGLSRLVDFYRGSRCLIVLKRDELSPEYIMHVVDNHKQNISEDPVEITETTANLLLSLPDTIAAAYNGRGKLRLRALKNNVIYDINTFQTEEKYLLQCATLFSLFDDESFITAPYRQQDVIAGRIYLIGSKQPFNRSDVAFIKQVADALSSVAENMHLIENLVEEAGGQERHRLSLDVHDTTIQPYIGLTLALDGLAREFKTNLPLAEKIGEIINMANMTVQDLRSYKDNLRQKAMMRGEFLIPAVQHHSERLLRFYGIQINVQGSVDPHRIEGLAEAAFQIIKEGLSNILRHTKARKGFVEIQCSETHLQIKIGNEINTALFNAASFKPKSIQERVLTLKGETTILNDVAGHTVVKVDIPLIKGRYFKD